MRKLLASLIFLILLYPATFGPGGIASGQGTQDFDIVLLIDRSSSIRETDPSEDRLEAMKLFVSLLDRGRLAIYSFGNDGREVLPLSNLEEEAQRSSILKLIDQELANQRIPEIGEATDMLEGLRKAYAHLSAVGGASATDGQVIILLTDGAPCPPLGFGNASEEKGYKNQIRDEVRRGREAGVYLFSFGFLPTSFVPNPEDPCENPDGELLSDLNRAGLAGLAENRPEIVQGFIDRPYLQEDESDPRPVSEQIVDRYIKAWQALFGISGRSAPLANGETIVVPPGTLALFAIVPFSGPVTPDLALLTPSGAEPIRKRVIGNHLVARKDGPEPGPRTVQLSNDEGNALLFYQLDFKVNVLDEIDGEPSPDSLPSGIEEAQFGLIVEPANSTAPDRSAALFDAGLLQLAARPHVRGSACAIPEPDETNTALEPHPTIAGAYVGRRVILPAVYDTGELEVLAGIAGLGVCDRLVVATQVPPAATPTPPLPTPSPSPPPPQPDGEGGGGWWIWLVLGGLSAVAITSVGLLYRALRAAQPDPLDGTLSGRGLAGGRVFLNMLGKRRATIGGPGSDIEVQGLTGLAATLFTQRGEPMDVTLVQPAGETYDISVARAGASSSIPVSGPTPLEPDSDVIVSRDGEEVARLSWR